MDVLDYDNSISLDSSEEYDTIRYLYRDESSFRYKCKSVFIGLLNMDSYRPILALTLLLLNIMLYKEDPTSYSSTAFKNTPIGYIYNHLFTNYVAAYNAGTIWFGLKLITVILYPIILSLLVEFIIRRFIFGRLLKCSGLKRDKGALLFFIFSILIGLYTGAIIFNTLVKNNEYVNDVKAIQLLFDHFNTDNIDYDELNRSRFDMLNYTHISSNLPDKCIYNQKTLESSIETLNKLANISKTNPKGLRYDILYCGFNPYEKSSLFDFYKSVDEIDTMYNRDDSEYLSQKSNDYQSQESDCLQHFLVLSGIVISPTDLKFTQNGYCHYVWSTILNISDADIIKGGNNSKSEKDDTIAPFDLTTLFLRDDIPWMTEGLFNRLSSLLTFICDAWTLFAIFDEWLQKRSRTRYLSSRASGNHICTWYNVRIQFFWLYMVIVTLLSIVHVSASVSYHSYNHRCDSLESLDFDNPIQFDSIFINTYSGLNFSSEHIYDDETFRRFFNVSPVGYDSIVFKSVYNYTNPNETSATNLSNSSCQNLWNDRNILGLSKSGRITLSVAILLIDLILVLFVSEFPTFQNRVKIRKKLNNLCPNNNIDEVSSHVDSLFEQNNTTRKYIDNLIFLHDKSIIYLDNRNFLRRILDVWCFRNVYYEHSDNHKSDIQTYIPGTTSVDIFITSSDTNCYPCQKSTGTLLDTSPKSDAKPTPRCGDKLCGSLCCNPYYGPELESVSPDEDSFDYFTEASDEYHPRDNSYFSVFCKGLSTFVRLLCCFCCYESCAKDIEKNPRSSGFRSPRKSSITAKWLIYGALLFATSLNIIGLIQQCTFEPVSFDQIETIDGSIHQLKKEILSGDDISNSTNLCLVCPEGIRKKSDPLDPKIETWYPMFKTVEWINIDTILKYGDITRSFTNSKTDTLGPCVDSFGDDAWSSEDSICNSWNMKDVNFPEFDKYETFPIGETLCHIKKRIKWKCGCSGYHEHESTRDINTFMSYYKKDEEYNNNNNTSRNPANDLTSIFLEPTFAQRDCNFDTSLGSESFWAGESVSSGGESIKNQRWYFDMSANNNIQKNLKTYCLTMDVLEWLEIICDHGNGEFDNISHTKTLNNNINIAQIEQVDPSILYNTGFDCWSCASKDIKQPSYLNTSNDYTTFNYAETAWGLESSNSFDNRYFWVGDISNNEDPYEKYFYPKDLEYTGEDNITSAIGIRKSSLSCKITTCPMGSYNTYNNETTITTSLYLTLIPAIVGGYMIWIMFWNYCTEMGFKKLYKVYYDDEKLINNGNIIDSKGSISSQIKMDYHLFKEKTSNDKYLFKKMALYRILIRLGLFMVFKCQCSRIYTTKRKD